MCLIQEHECKLTQEILELIDREVDLMMRGVKQDNLEGLRKRIATLFFHYIKTPLFNPEVSRHLKVLYFFPVSKILICAIINRSIFKFCFNISLGVYEEGLIVKFLFEQLFFMLIY